MNHGHPKPHPSILDPEPQPLRQVTFTLRQGVFITTRTAALVSFEYYESPLVLSPKPPNLEP